jgi:transcription-repair coupling factor (superfamily II helicase)
MIDQAVKELQGKSTVEQLLPSVTLPLSALIPADYIPTDGLRIAFYKKVAACRIPDDVNRVQAELEDRFGDPPESVWNMLAIMRLRIDAPLAGVGKIDTDKGTVILWLARKIEKDEARELMRHNRRIQVLNDRLLMYFDDGEKPLPKVEQMIKLLKKGGGKQAAQAVQRQLKLAETLAAAKSG